MVGPQVRLVEYPAIPDFDPDRTILVFPSRDAVAIPDLVPGSFDRVLFIDSTWAQTNRIVTVRLTVIAGVSCRGIIRGSALPW